jgi:hypothetical protein
VGSERPLTHSAAPLVLQGPNASEHWGIHAADAAAPAAAVVVSGGEPDHRL